MKKIRVGAVGVGGIWNGPHIKGILNSKDLELTAICDINEEKLKAAAEKYGIDEAHCFTKYEDLIACEDVDAIDIATSNDAHFAPALAAAKAKKPYAIEKPITLTSEEADELCKVTTENGVKNMICFSYRFKSAARYIKDLIARGKIGEIYHVQAQYFQAWGVPSFGAPRIWRFDKKMTGSGALGDLGCHALDLVRFITGKDYKSVVAHTGTFVNERKLPNSEEMAPVDVDDFSNYMVEMEDGISGSFQITRYAFGRGNYQRIEIYGSKGSLVYLLDVNGDGKDRVEACSGEIGQESHTFAELSIPEKYDSEQMQSFADIINDCGDGMPATIFDGMVNQHVIDAILSSAETKQWKTID